MVDVDAAQTPGPQGVPGRVAEAQAQTRPTLVLVAVYLLAGALVLAVSGATQFLAVTWGAGPAPRRGPVAVQRWLVVAGAALAGSRGCGVGRGRHPTRATRNASAGSCAATTVCSNSATRCIPRCSATSSPAFQGPATAHAAPSSCRSNSTEYCVMLSGSSWLSGCDPGGPRPPTTEARRR
jgi:hypothetical protein